MYVLLVVVAFRTTTVTCFTGTATDVPDVRHAGPVWEYGDEVVSVPAGQYQAMNESTRYCRPSGPAMFDCTGTHVIGVTTELDACAIVSAGLSESVDVDPATAMFVTVDVSPSVPVPTLIGVPTMICELVAGDVAAEGTVIDVAPTVVAALDVVPVQYAPS